MQPISDDIKILRCCRQRRQQRELFMSLKMGYMLNNGPVHTSQQRQIYALSLLSKEPIFKLSPDANGPLLLKYCLMD